MEQMKKSHTVRVEDIQRKSLIKKNLINIIHNEYCLKRNKFNPAQPSPNIFCNRLEIRMKTYYNNLYKPLNL